jgi:LysR family transcriptional regulator, transcriptional activator of the cysJI operon
MYLEARLRAFAAFVRRRSFSAAAAELRISQPAISKHVADLERVLGLGLVDRSRRDGTLTDAGKFIANRVLRAEALLAQASRGAAELRTSGTGSLTIAASWLTGTYLLPAVIAEFKHVQPGVHVSLELGTATQALDALRSHRAELGFIANAVGGPEIEVEPLLENEIAIVGRRSVVPKQLSRENLEALTWISREEGSATRAVSDRALARLGIVPTRRLELPSYEAVLSALMRGYGVSAISRYVVADALRARSLVVLPLRDWNVRNVVSMLRVRDATLTPAANQFQMLIRRHFAATKRQRLLTRR